MIYDMTRLMGGDMPLYPGDSAPTFEVVSSYEKDGYHETRINITSHVGTHMDAPAHVIEGGKFLESYPLERFFGNAFVLNCEGCKNIGISQLERVPEDCDTLIFSTGSGKLWGKDEYFYNFPTLTREAAEQLSHMGIKTVGYDVCSPDSIDAHDLPIHHILLENDILIIENLYIPGELLEKSFKIAALPVKYENSDGAAARVAAFT